jgi:acyl-CoA dehydrogenase
VVPPDHVIGEASLGLEYAHRALTWGRTFMAAGCLGPAQATIAQVEEHAATRVQFGRPLLKFPLVRHQLAECRALVYAMESVIRLVCHGFDSGSFDIALPSAVAKILCSESAWAVVDRGIQILGGLGYMEDANLARRLRDLRVTRIFEGANDVLRLSLASATLGWVTDPLAGARPAGTRADALVARVIALVDRVRKQHGVRLFDRQVLQSHLADAIISAYGALACAIRAAEARGQELATAEFAMRLLTERADAAMAAAEHLDEASDRARVDAVLEG